MNILKIKPLSVNKVWQGKRFKTKDYSIYENIVKLMLKPILIPTGPLKIDYVF
jgi:hypothetical protein